MQTVSSAFLVVLALATQSFAAPLELPGSYGKVSSLVDSYLTSTSSLPASTSIPTYNPPVSYGAPGGYGHGNHTVLPSGSGKVGPTGTGVSTISKPTGTGVSSKSTAKSTVSKTASSTASAPTATSSGAVLHGDGSTWPTIDKWVSFDQIWASNLHNIEQSCNGFPNATDNNKTPPLNSQQETNFLYDAILSEANSTKVDKRYILSTVLQESHGCIHVGYTVSNDGVFNPGVMQDHNGPHNCKDVPEGQCSKEEIQGMIHDGTFGTWAYPLGGDGLAGVLTNATTEGAKEGTAQQYYWASRIYNSGSYKKGSDLSDPPNATPNYSSDIAYRLTGAVF